MRTSRRLTFGGQDYKTPAAAKVALDDLHEQLEGLEKTVSQSLDDSRGNEDPNSDRDSDDVSDLGKPINMQEAVLEIDAAGLPANLAMSTQTMLMGTIDLEELNPKFREIGENNCRSMKQAADWFRKSDPSTPDKPNQLGKLKASAKAGGASAIAEIQNTLTWLWGHKWDTTESHALIIHTLTEDAGLPGAGYSDAVSQLLDMFCWMMPVDRKRFKQLTKDGKMEPKI